MKLNRYVPARQKPILDYMRTLEPVSKTLNDLIKAVSAVAKDADYATLPASVKTNKGLDGFHTESSWVKEFLDSNPSLLLRVQRGYIAQEQGYWNKILQKHLRMSDRFDVAFLSTKWNSNGKDRWHPGIEFTIMRDGILHEGVSSATAVTA